MIADQHNSLRKVAILVMTLDEVRAQQLLDDLPPQIAQQVIAFTEDLEDVSALERESIVAEFRQHMTDGVHSQAQTNVPPTAAHQGVELDDSLMRRMESQETSDYQDDYSKRLRNQDTRPASPLEHADVDTMARLLMREHPQTIAVVLSRVDYDRAAQVLEKIPMELQADVLSRMGKLDVTDQQSIEVIESQIAERIDSQRQQQNRMAVGANLVQRILNQSPEKETILERIGRSDPSLARNLQDSAEQTAIRKKPKQQTRTVATDPLVRRAYQAPPLPSPETSHAKPTQRLQTSLPTEDLADPMQELEKASTAALHAGFSHVDERTLMLALIGASEELLQRVLKGLPRKQAKQFRAQLSNIGPLRLSDMVAAQKDLLRLVRSYSS